MSTHDQTYPRGGITESEFNVAGPLSQNSTYKRNYLDLCRHMIKRIHGAGSLKQNSTGLDHSINLFDFLKCTYKLSQLMRKSSCIAYVESLRHWYADSQSDSRLSRGIRWGDRGSSHIARRSPVQIDTDTARITHEC